MYLYEFLQLLPVPLNLRFLFIVPPFILTKSNTIPQILIPILFLYQF